MAFGSGLKSDSLFIRDTFRSVVVEEQGQRVFAVYLS